MNAHNERTIKKDPIFEKQATLSYVPNLLACLVQPVDSYREESYWLYVNGSSRLFSDAEIGYASNLLSTEAKKREACKIRQVNRENREQGINKPLYKVCL